MEPIPAVLYRYIAALKAHDVDAVASTAAADIAFIGATRTLDKAGFLAMLRALYTGFPDWHYDHDPPRRNGEILSVRWRQGGTHTGVFALPGLEPIAPTGRTVLIPEHDFFYRARADLLVEIRPDPVPGGAPRGILQQIGVALPPL